MPPRQSDRSVVSRPITRTSVKTRASAPASTMPYSVEASKGPSGRNSGPKTPANRTESLGRDTVRNRFSVAKENQQCDRGRVFRERAHTIGRDVPASRTRPRESESMQRDRIIASEINQRNRMREHETLHRSRSRDSELNHREVSTMAPKRDVDYRETNGDVMTNRMRDEAKHMEFVSKTMAMEQMKIENALRRGQMNGVREARTLQSEPSRNNHHSRGQTRERENGEVIQQDYRRGYGTLDHATSATLQERMRENAMYPDHHADIHRSQTLRPSRESQSREHINSYTIPHDRTRITRPKTWPGKILSSQVNSIILFIYKF